VEHGEFEVIRTAKMTGLEKKKDIMPKSKVMKMLGPNNSHLETGHKDFSIEQRSPGH